MAVEGAPSLLSSPAGRRRRGVASRSLFLIVVMLAAASAIILAQIGASAPSASRFLGHVADHLIDQDGALTARDLRGAAAGRFTPSNGRMVNRGVAGGPRSILWLRVRIPDLEGARDRDWVVSLQETRVREATLYLPRGDGEDIALTVRPGVRDPRTGLAPRFASFTFEAGKISGETVLIRVFTRSSKRALLWVEPYETFVAGEVRQTLMFGVLCGVLVGLFVYLLALGLILRNGSLVVLAVFVASFCTYVVSDRAFLESLLAPGALKASRFLSIMGVNACYASWLTFLTLYLRARARLPWLALAAYATIAAAIVLILAAAIEVWRDTSYLRLVFSWFGLGSILLGLLIVIMSYRAEKARVLAFLVCWSPAVFAAVSRIMLDASPAAAGGLVSVYGIYVAAVFSLLTFSIVLSLDLQDREVTLRTIAEHQEQRFRSFARAASDGFWETDAAGALTSLTGRLAANRGFTPGLPFIDLLRAQARESDLGPIASAAAAMRAERPFRALEITLQRAGEAAMVIDVSGEPFHVDGVFGGYRGVISDVTERRVRQETEVRQQRMAAIGQMASGIAHEINNLLHPIINLSRRVRDRLATDDEGRSYLQIVLDSGDRARAILANVLAAVRPSERSTAPAPFLEVIRETAEEIRTVLGREPAIEIDVEGEGGPLITRTEAFQVLSNLVSNAAHAIKSGGRIRITAGAKPRDGAVAHHLIVSDDGEGMTPEVAGRALEAFYTTKPPGAGVGLGLATVATIVEAWGGTIRIRSERGAGADIIIELAESRKRAQPDERAAASAVG